MLNFSGPWEARSAAYVTVIKDGAICRMYYRGTGRDPATGPPADLDVICYAESRDGVAWTKPGLSLHAFHGSTTNHITMVPGSTAGLTHNFTPFLDQRPGVPAGERLKAIAGSHGSGVFRFASAGEVRVELQRADGRPVPGFTLEDAAPLVGDKVEGEVSWRSNARLATLAGQPVRLRSVMRDAGLHSLQLTAT